MQIKLRLIIISLLVSTWNVWTVKAMQRDEKASARVAESQRVLGEIMSAPDRGLPRDLLAKAHCIVIIPSLKKAGFVFGAEYGKGIVSCRAAGKGGWTGPSMVRIEGGSFGFQIGGAATDLVLLVMNDHGAEKLMHSQFTLGGDGTVAAGPVGRSAKAGTDATMNAKILAYARSRGIFAGIALEGATLRVDNGDNETIYGREVNHKEILLGKIATPPAGRTLIRTLDAYSRQES